MKQSKMMMLAAVLCLGLVAVSGYVVSAATKMQEMKPPATMMKDDASMKKGAVEGEQDPMAAGMERPMATEMQQPMSGDAQQEIDAGMKKPMAAEMNKAAEGSMEQPMQEGDRKR